MNIVIIGAGPAGSCASELLAKKGYNVKLFEEHSEIGKPVQCTGIVTNAINEIIKVPKEAVINKITHAKICSPDKSSIEIKFKNPNLVLDREQFDKALAERAEDAGAEIFLNSRFEKAISTERIAKKNVAVIISKNKNCQRHHFDYLIGADGPLSRVAKGAGLFGRRQFVSGLQARVRTDVDKKLVEFWLGIGKFGWLVPESDRIVRLGVIGNNENLKQLFKARCKNAKILDKQAGLIPIYSPNSHMQKRGILLVGDAAGQVKASTYGGLVPGLGAAKILASDIKHYEKNFRKGWGRELWLALAMRKILDRFTIQDCNKLIALASKERVKAVLEEEERDFPMRLLLKLLLAEPRFALFARKILS